ncbi:hypothetical protein BGZ60DRAFT_388937 [Tricladium varicosporioides]|nr:hypothetical protein BGZ60DRAFT_388937 [Hymenoscyphus varicosporioides]
MYSLLTTLALVATASAQYYANQSAPFNLVLKSSNSTLNGSALYACHEGAAIEGLCLGGPPTNSQSDVFTFNTTSIPDVNTTGLLTWELHGGNFNLSSPLSFSYNPASNVAFPVFMPSDTSNLQVGFDECGKMYVSGYQDDTKPLPNYEASKLYRWVICKTYYGYLYTTLAWVMGKGEAQNPTCQAVEVYRVFV